jgi:hypothetical protein
VDDVLIFLFCAESEGMVLKYNMDLFCEATRMVININKSTIYFPKLAKDQRLPKVDIGAHIQVSRDAIVGCSDCIFLLDGLVSFL